MGSLSTFETESLHLGGKNKKGPFDSPTIKHVVLFYSERRETVINSDVDAMVHPIKFCSVMEMECVLRMAVF